ncbi:hypothetical protein J4E91_009183 [Alternaria rosae]|nr:hypothetical protein J4E91_009183 [Alternaria rosae]
MLDEFCSLLDNEDFQSLRLTYRRIYRFTDADAAVRYEDKLHEIEIWCNHQSLYEDEQSDEDTQSDESEETKETEQERRVRKANENRKALEQGYHVKDYRLNQPQIASFFHGLRSVPRLWLNGCDDFPRLRFCNACNDIFAYSIAKVPCTHLTTLNIRCMYISGGRLQRFIKQQAHTLENIYIDSTTLTDGYWKNFARVLKKVSSLEQLFLRGRLR